jgi:hypothetical protein
MRNADIRNDLSGADHSIDVFEDGSVAEIHEHPSIRVKIFSDEVGYAVKRLKPDTAMRKMLKAHGLAGAAYDLETQEMTTKAVLRKRKRDRGKS